MPAKQQLMICTTESPNIRSRIEGWTFEDGNMVVQGKEIGFTGSPRFPCYPSVLHAIGDGWRLMAPPSKFSDTEFEWWLESYV